MLGWRLAQMVVNAAGINVADLFKHQSSTSVIYPEGAARSILVEFVYFLMGGGRVREEASETRWDRSWLIISPNGAIWP